MKIQSPLACVFFSAMFFFSLTLHAEQQASPTVSMNTIETTSTIKPSQQTTSEKVTPEQLASVLKKLQTLQQKYDELQIKYHTLAIKADQLQTLLDQKQKADEQITEPKYTMRYKFRPLTKEEISTLKTDKRVLAKVNSDEATEIDLTSDQYIKDNFIAATITIQNTHAQSQRLALSLSLINKVPRTGKLINKKELIDTLNLNTEYIEPKRTIQTTLFFENAGSKTNFLIASSEKAFKKVY
ncbi:hypothetical protein JD969_14990 [Planctomycetota bacterium]|nr:hypothetical protein JD969_14990 [Planctomycetota bacterium]